MLKLFVFLLMVTLAWYLWEKRQRKTHAMAGGLHRDITLPTSRSTNFTTMACHCVPRRFVYA